MEEEENVRKIEEQNARKWRRRRNLHENGGGGGQAKGQGENEEKNVGKNEKEEKEETNAKKKPAAHYPFQHGKLVNDNYYLVILLVAKKIRWYIPLSLSVNK